MAIKANIKKQDRSQVNNLTQYLKELKKNNMELKKNNLSPKLAEGRK